MPGIWQSLGVFTTTSGTATRFSSKLSKPTEVYWVDEIFVQPIHTNTGYVVIGQSDVKWGAPPTNPLVVLPVPSFNVVPSIAMGRVVQTNVQHNVADYFFDVSVSGEGVLISVLTNEKLI